MKENNKKKTKRMLTYVLDLGDTRAIVNGSDIALLTKTDIFQYFFLLYNYDCGSIKRLI